MNDARLLSGAALAQALRDSRARTWSVVADLDDRQWRVPRRAGLNPFAWELGHIAWFADFWIRRGPHRVGEDGFVHAAQPARPGLPDAVFDSSRLAHAARWDVALPSRARLRDWLAGQLEDCIAAIPPGDSDGDLYFHRLALFHEDMHGEAFAWMRSSMGCAAPHGMALRQVREGGALRLDASRQTVGSPAGTPGFAFDNERNGRIVDLDAHEIDAAPVTNRQFLRFVEDGGYDDPAWWPGAAAAWRAGCDRHHPERWRPGARGWEMRWFDRWLPLDDDQPVIHVNAHEAEAWCRWAGRRLPRAAEWEHAARTAGAAFDWGHAVWEWTGDDFLPYPAFEPGPYKDYSAPWFGNHRELRGGAWATHARLHDPRYRNFFMPQRTDVFAGFRSAAGGPAD